MLQQYFRIKSEHPGVLLAMRVGDFYEFYGEDAETAARDLDITLTGRDDGGERVAMAGVPFHSVERYLARLVSQGHRVAICDQLEDPKKAKGLVKRGVTRILSSGTVIEDSMLQSGLSNFLAAVCVNDGKVGLAVLEPSTGEFLVTEWPESTEDDRLLSELGRFRPSELLVGDAQSDWSEVVRHTLGSLVTPANPLRPDRAADRIKQALGVAQLEGFGCADKPQALVAASMVLQYATQNGLSLAHVESLTTYTVDGCMRMDLATRRSLEITENLQDRTKRYTLLDVLDATRSPMGLRLLRRWLEEPLLDIKLIQVRHDAVGRFFDHARVREEVRDHMGKMADMERLLTRCVAGVASPRDLGALRQSLRILPKFNEPLAHVSFGRIAELKSQIASLAELRMLLESALNEELPQHARDGGIMRKGFDPELDKLRDLSRNGKDYIAALEASEREKTGIGTLKVGFNSVFGYYLEVGKAHQAKVPEHYIRKQTTANAERYITAELKDHESLVLGAEEKSVGLEQELFEQLRIQITEHGKAIRETSRALAEIDVLASLAETARYRNYVRPEMLESDALEIVNGRHPVVEAGHGAFVPNHVDFQSSDIEGCRQMVITGPNMSGKSTYLRQVALIALMAQMGSFIPAESARMGMVDRIFARIGAKDEIALGQSTFMVEMIESANILNHATDRSLVILDEVGRGTSTFDGMAIAWAMCERLVELGCRTMFATHYHQLNTLADSLPTVRNFRVSVEEFGADIVWTHKVLPGGADKSYGIHVAKMAGVPRVVLDRAREILQALESGGDAAIPVPARHERLQLTLFDAERPEVLDALGSLDVEKLTPVQALLLLDEWKRKWGGPS